MKEATVSLDIAKWCSILDIISEIFASAYQSLSTNKYDYLLQALQAKEVTSRSIENSLPQFDTLNNSELSNLLSMSYHLGVPLSPLGLTTFTSGALQDMLLTVKGGAQISIGGEYLHPSRFKSTELSRLGLWIVQTPDAADFYEKEFNRQALILDHQQPKSNSEEGVLIGKPVPVVSKRLFPPTTSTLKRMEEYITHEAFHGVHIPLAGQFTRLNAFDRLVLREGLAYRTGFILGARTLEEIKSSVAATYSNNLLDNEYTQLGKVIDLTTKTMDPSYQCTMTWIGLGATCVDEFLDPPTKLLRFSEEMSSYSISTVLPSFSQKLGL